MSYVWFNIKDKLPDRPTQKVIVKVKRYYLPSYMDVSRYKGSEWIDLTLQINEEVTHWTYFPTMLPD